MAMGQAAPDGDLAIEIRLETLVLGLGAAGQVFAHDLDGVPEAGAGGAGEGVGFAHDAEAAEADLLAEHVVAHFLALVVGLGRGFFARPFGEEGGGGREGGGGAAAPGGGGLLLPARGPEAGGSVEGVGFGAAGRGLASGVRPGAGFFERGRVVPGRVDGYGRDEVVHLLAGGRGEDFFVDGRGGGDGVEGGALVQGGGEVVDCCLLWQWVVGLFGGESSFSGGVQLSARRRADELASLRVVVLTVSFGVRSSQRRTKRTFCKLLEERSTSQPCPDL